MSIGNPPPGISSIVWSLVGNTHGAKIDPSTANPPLTATLTAGYEPGDVTVRARITYSGGPPRNLDQVVRIGGGGSCSSGSCGAGSATVQLNNLDFSLGLGKDKDGERIGELRLYSESGSVNLASPYALSAPSSGGALVVNRDTRGMITRISAPETVVDVVYAPAILNQYTLDFSAAGPGGEPLGSPFVTWEVKKLSPTGTEDDLLQITKKTGGTTKAVYEYRHFPPSGSKNWSLTFKDSAQATLRTETSTWSGNIRTYTVQDGVGAVLYRAEFTYDGTGSYLLQRKAFSAATGTEGLTTTREYYPSDDTVVARRGLLRLEILPNGYWSWYDYDSSGRRSRIVHPWKDALPPVAPATPDTGQTVEITYDYELLVPGDNSEQNGRDFPIDMRPRKILTKVLGNETERTYRRFTRPTAEGPLTVTEVRCGTPGQETFQPTNLGNLTTVTTYVAGDDDKVAQVSHPDGRVDVYQYELGTFTENPEDRGNHNQFAPSPTGPDQRTTVSHGYLSGTTVQYSTGKSTQDVRVSNQFGAARLLETNVATSSGGDWQQVGWRAHVLDSQGRISETYRSDGTRFSASWSCCGPDQTTDETGIVTTYEPPDALGRRATVTKEGVDSFEGYPEQSPIVTSYSLDAAWRLLGTTVSSDNLSLSTSKTNDLLGRVATYTEAGLTTQYYYCTRPVCTDPSAPGCRRTETILPGGAQRITEQYLDGRLRCVLGNAVVARYYDYGYELLDLGGGMTLPTVWTRSTIGTENSPRYEKTWVDMLGRRVQMEKPGFWQTEGELATIRKNWYYNPKGRLARVTSNVFSPDGTRASGGGGGIDPGCADCPPPPGGGGGSSNPNATWLDDGGDVCYEYDGEMGDLFRSGTKVEGEPPLQPGGSDRITETTTSYVNANGAWWLESNTYVYPTIGSDGRLLSSRQRQQLTGLTAPVVRNNESTDSQGLITKNTTTISRGSKKVTETTDLPLSTTNAVTISVNGLTQTFTSGTNLTYTYYYDALGRRTTTIDPRTGPAITQYRPDGRVDLVLDTAGNPTTYEYYPDTGRLWWVTNPASKKTYYEYNDRGQVTHVWGDVPQPVENVYDPVYGQRTQLSTYRDASVTWNDSSWPANPGDADTTTWDFDEATGLVTQKTYDVSVNFINYKYTIGGALFRRSWSRPCPTCTDQVLKATYGYDLKTGELTAIDYSDTTPDVTYTYDRLGRSATVTQATTPATIHTFAYDGMEPYTETIAGVYDKVITRLHTPPDVSVPQQEQRTLQIGLSGAPAQDYESAYTYDLNTGRLSSVTGPGLPWLGAVYTYRLNSDLVERVFYELDFDTILGVAYKDYEPDRDLVKSVQNSWGGQLVSRYDYQNDELSRRTSVVRTGEATDTDHLELYGYNDRNELVSSERHEGTDPGNPGNPVSGQHHQYDYDPIGNRMTYQIDSGTATTYARNSLNQYPSTSNPSETFAYDRDGNLTSDAVLKYTWDAENRLSVVEPKGTPPANSKKLTFSYDYMGRRIRKQVFNRNGTNWDQIADLRFVYDAWNLIMELDGSNSNAILRKYTWGQDLSGSLQGAGGISGLLAMQDTNWTADPADDRYYCYFYDANGNVGQLIQLNVPIPNPPGPIPPKYEYDPYGNRYTTTPSLDEAFNPFRFSTKYFDDEVGLYYYGYRYYLPRLGRWGSRDPAGEDGSDNLYAFLRNTPIASFDPFGLREFKKCTAEEKAQLEAALSRADREIGSLAEAINEAIRNDKGQYPAFTRLKLLKARDYLACARWNKLMSADFECPCAGGTCDGAYAWVKWVIGRTIRACPDFFKSPPFGWNKEKFRASVLIHEATHMCGTTDADYFWQNGNPPKDTILVGYQDIASTYDTWILRGFCIPGYNCR